MFKPKGIITDQSGNEIFCPWGMWGMCYILSKPEQKKKIVRFQFLSNIFGAIALLAAIYYESWFLFILLIAFSFLLSKFFIADLIKDMEVSKERYRFATLCNEINKAVGLNMVFMFMLFTAFALVPFSIYSALTIPEETTYHIVVVSLQVCFAIFLMFCFKHGLQQKKSDENQ